MRFLVVDDSSTMRRIIINTLNKLGYQEIVEASNGREGIDKLSAAEVDMVITDWNMPEMNGVEFLKNLRSTGNGTRFGFITSETHPAIKAQALEAGADFLITKPFSADKFGEVVGGLVS